MTEELEFMDLVIAAQLQRLHRLLLRRAWLLEQVALPPAAPPAVVVVHACNEVQDRRQRLLALMAAAGGEMPRQHCMKALGISSNELIQVLQPPWFAKRGYGVWGLTEQAKAEAARADG